MIGFPPGKLRARKVLLPAGALAAIVLILAWVFSFFVGHGGSGGGGSGTARQIDTQRSAPVAPRQPMEVVIQEDRYLVGGKEMSLDQIVSAAGAAGGGVAVKIVSGPDSRLGAERELQNALDAAHLLWSLESQPLSQP